jgi:hypothetical protein
MPVSYRSTITAIGLCTVLGTAGACSSDSSPLDNRDAQISDVSRDGEGPNDTVTPDAAVVDVSVIDTVATDTTLIDVVSIDTASGDAGVDALLSDRTSTDASSTDRVPDDSTLPDAPADSASADTSSTDSTSADAPPTDSTSADAPPGDGGNDPRCPPSYGAASGQQCPSTSLTCVYAEGACGCIIGCGALPPPDAGSRWYCAMRGAGCPMQKPTVGSPCSMDAQSCNYGTCCADRMVCENSAWKSGGFLCPP